MNRADRASLTLGCLLYVGSAPFLLIMFDVFSTLKWNELGGTFESWGPCILILLAELVIGLVLIGRGLLRAFGGLRFTIGRLMIAVLVVALGLASSLLGSLTFLKLWSLPSS